MKRVMVVVDMQKDFVTAALGTKEAQAIVPELVKEVKDFEGQIVYTMDTHEANYMSTQEGKNLPVPHCIKGTDGWKMIDELDALKKEKNVVVFEKPTFPSKDLAMYLAKENEKERIEEIILVGVCTDICVIANALTIKAFLPETPISMIENLTAATTPKMKEETIDVMKCCQIDII